MQITRQADYAVRAVLYLAQLGPEQRAATSQIAEEQQIPPSFLAKIVSQLSVAGLLRGSEESIEAFIQWLHKGSPYGRVDTVEVEREGPDEHAPPSFGTRY